jgi:hypothetical protein
MRDADDLIDCKIRLETIVKTLVNDDPNLFQIDLRQIQMFIGALYGTLFDEGMSVKEINDGLDRLEMLIRASIESCQ